MASATVPARLGTHWSPVGQQFGSCAIIRASRRPGALRASPQEALESMRSTWAAAAEQQQSSGGSWDGSAPQSAMAQVVSAAEAVRSSLQSSFDLALPAQGALLLPPHWGATLSRQWATAVEQWVSLVFSGAAQGIWRPAPDFAAALANLQALLLQAGSGLSSTGSLPETLSTAVSPVRQAAQQAWEQLASVSHSAGALSDLPASLVAGWAVLQATKIGGYSGDTVALIAAGVLALVAASTLRDDGRSGGGPGASGRRRTGGAGELPDAYDPDSVARYYERQPLKVAARSLEIAREALLIGAALLVDASQGRLQENSPERAVQLRCAIEYLGPAAIKVAQALSTRVDVLNASYLSEIERLQDCVPPFEDALAWDMISEAFGKPVSSVFGELPPAPIAAASLGQVYKGTFVGADGPVPAAIKVQRPGVLDSVALDLHLMRRFALLVQQLPQVRTNWAGLIDEWAIRFWEELDYTIEAANAARFKQDVIDEELTGIVVPNIYLATQQVLVMEFIEGEKLAESTASDVRKLCDTLLSAYLSQLLDTGFLHADPHPGNLLRTPDGKLAILDYGLMTTVPAEYSLSLVEYIAHLTTGDYESVADDLVKLGFVPPWAPSPRESGLADPLGRILSQLAAGGGAAKINVDSVMEELKRLQLTFPYFEIPAYFALILRCFSVIEGIALRSDPDYAIVQECFPYLSRRLLTDNHPRARAALRQVLFGDKEHIDAERLQLLVTGLQQYTVSGLGDATPDAAEQPIIGSTARDALRVVFSPEGSYAQELLVEEAVAATDAAARQLASMLVTRLLGNAPALAGLSAIQALQPWRPVPLPAPAYALSSLAATLEPNDGDRQAMAVASVVQQALLQTAPARLDPQQSLQFVSQLAGELSTLLPDLLPGAAKTGELFARKLARRASERVEQGLRSYNNNAGL